MPSPTAQALIALLALAAMLPCGPPSALAEDDDGRQDVTIGNPDRQRSGVNERGDNEMVVEPKPRRKQQVPDMGPIYVVPQVNTGRGQAPVILPVPQGPQPRQQGPAQPPAPGRQP